MNNLPDNAVLFTVGHSNHEMAKFLQLLKLHEITVVADVRSSPFSRFNPQFNRDQLQAALHEIGVRYVFMGNELGARRSEQECRVGEKVSYQRVAELPLFIEGLERLKKGVAGHRVALMCAEKDPLTCHRAILICRNLRRQGIAIQHILEDGITETHEAAEDRLLKMMKLPPGDLFDGKDTLVEEAYDRQAEKIAYSAMSEEMQQDVPG